MKLKVFVDGQAGTTGLKISERLAGHPFVETLAIPAEKRKDPDLRREFLHRADFAFLCLPDAAAREAAALAAGGRARLIDASTAHRTETGWAYGLPELGKVWREGIAAADRVSVPGCHATGFILSLYPLVASGVVPRDYPAVCHSLTGYSGGGRELIGKYRSADRPASFAAPQHYALGLRHKHLPEMRQRTGLAEAPLFTPIVGDFYQGMTTAVPLHRRLLPGKETAEDIQAALAGFYQNERYVRVLPFGAEELLADGFFNPMACNGTNRVEILVCGHGEQILILARFDNLGKGSSGAAVQIMNIMAGFPEETGLEA